MKSVFQPPFLFSALLLTAGSSAIACALYAARGTYKPPLNKLLTAMCLALLLWCLDLAIRVCAVSRWVALAGSYLAPLGGAPLFGLLVHYILILTGRPISAGRKWVYALIYLPGAAVFWGLSVLPLFGQYTPVLNLTPLGWVNNSRNVWIWFYCVYCAVFLLAALVLLWQWARKSVSAREKKQARSLSLSILAMTLLGWPTAVLPRLLQIQFPGMAALFAILPILTICRQVNQTDSAQPAPPNQDEVILNSSHGAKSVYLVLSAYFFMESQLNLISQSFPKGGTNLHAALIFSGLLVLGGLAALTFRRFPWDDGLKELALSLLFAATIPVIVFAFWKFGSTTVWAIIILPLIPSMLFNRRILLVTVLMSGFQTQLILMGARPYVFIQVDSSDYVVRIGLILLAACFCVFVSLVYRRRLRENAMHTVQQRTAAAVSQTLLLADPDNWREKFTQVLELIGTLFQYQQVRLSLFDGEEQEIVSSCEWHRDAPSPANDAESHLLAAIRGQLQPGHILILRADDSLSPASVSLQSDMRQLCLRCIATVPIVQGGHTLGFLCLSFAQFARGEKSGFSQFLSIISNMLADSLVKLKVLERMRFIAYHDQLTGLPNRLLLTERLNQAIAQAMYSGKLLCVIFLDLDTFKSINDTMGHEIGDQLLIQVARAFSGYIGAEDIAARFGGDEFVFLLSQIPNEKAVHRMVQEIMNLIRRPVVLQGQEFFMTGSAGAALYPQDGCDAETLIANADIAMYHAKQLGKNRFVLCSQTLREETANQIRLTRLLSSAQEQGQLELYYQPQISLETREITGLEALLRWNLPGSGLLSPNVFIPLAEKAGLIQSIGRWVMETACRQSRLWQEEGYAPIRMAVNVSVQELSDAHFVRHVAEMLDRTGLDPQLLELELTESVAYSGATDVANILTDLKRLGVSLSIDDFGTEYSSLNRLKALPVDRLKLDMQFVHGIESNEKDRAITNTIILLARNLNIGIIAEGVETDTQLRFLKGRLCDEAQGFYYFNPMPAGEVTKYLRGSSGPSAGKSEAGIITGKG